MCIDEVFADDAMDDRYVLLGVAANDKEQLHIVRFIVNRPENELASIEVLATEDRSVFELLGALDSRSTIPVSALLEYIGIQDDADFVDKQGDEGYNEQDDGEEYERYKQLLGKNAPKTFADFLKIKYSDDWEAFKAYSKAIKSGELASLASFDLYQEISTSIDRNLVGTTTSEGILVRSKSAHFINRVIGSVEQRRSGVTVQEIKQALSTPERIDSKKGKEGVSVRYFGKSVIVTVNPQTGNLIQTNPRHQKAK